VIPDDTYATSNLKRDAKGCRNENDPTIQTSKPRILEKEAMYPSMIAGKIEAGESLTLCRKYMAPMVDDTVKYHCIEANPHNIAWNCANE
jgi:hypothetical protein